MITALSNNFLMRNRAYLMKLGETEKDFFKFADIDFKRSMYNQVGGNIVSQKVDKAIQTNWELDFNIKDYVFINEEKYMIVEIPPFQKLNPLGRFDKLVTLRLIRIAN